MNLAIKLKVFIMILKSDIKPPKQEIWDKIIYKIPMTTKIMILNCI